MSAGHARARLASTVAYPLFWSLGKTWRVVRSGREHLESLFEAKERKGASIQEYMERKQAVQYVEADKA